MKERYKRMLRTLAARPRRGRREWSVYILRCSDGSLYTGVAKDPAARYKAHAKGKGAAYTRAHRPVGMLYRKDGMTRSQALVKEAAIKRLPRARKEALAAGEDRPKGR